MDQDDGVQLRKLWLAVILRAREDADGVNTNHQSEGGLRELKREGRQWLIGDNILGPWEDEEDEGGRKWKSGPWNRWDLELVCEMAGVEAVTVIEMARRRFYGRETRGEEVL